jgi:cytochrome c oxidase assembly protein subunit 15
MNEENKNSYISYWILLITFLVAIMIVIGGLTRLTDSGLSITNWDLFAGILPPTNIEKWQYIFSLYKQIPEYKLLNSSMTLNEFKVIFWWEYIHRLLGRIIGLFFLIPLIYFSLKKILNNKDLFYFYSIFFLICIQGFIGWYMVKSGLSERTDVSHYRLSLHLTIAFIIFCLLVSSYLRLNNNSFLEKRKSLPINLPYIFTFLILLQISVGAFVSGLDAGQIYQTWPLMNQYYFPDDSKINELFSVKSFEIPSLVQFMHRNLAYLILLIFSLFSLNIFTNSNYIYLRKTTFYVSLFLLLQIFLGILTILSGAHIAIASAHQVSSIFLVAFSLILVFKNTKIN